MKASSTRPRFPGLHLSGTDRRFLATQTRAGRAVSARTWKRIRILELLHAEWSLADVAAALGRTRARCGASAGGMSSEASTRR